MLLLSALAACTADSGARALPALPPKVTESAPTAGTPQPLREAIVAFTGEVRGEIEACGCPTIPYGGFARRARLLDRLRQEGPPVFVLDAGMMLVKGEVGRDPVDRALRARTVLDLGHAVGLDAWAASRVDASVGAGTLAKDAGALAANWPGWPASVDVERGGVRLRVVGLGDTPPNGTSTDAVAAVTAALQGPPVDLAVVLSSAGDDVDRAVAERVPGLAAVLAVRGGLTEPPRTTTGAPILETPDRGRYVSVLHLALGSVPGPLRLTADGPLVDLAKVRGQLARSGDASPLKDELDHLRTRLATEGAGFNLVTTADLPLGSELDGPSVVDTLVDRFKSASRDNARAAVATPAAGPTYAGASACTRCHTDFFAAWLLNPHAHAIEPLAKAGKSDDPECIGCHSTGYGQPGGFAKVDEASLATFGAVQCEACHGPLANHPGSTAPKPVTEATCTVCHDSANSPSFAYASYRDQLSCVDMKMVRQTSGTGH